MRSIRQFSRLRPALFAFLCALALPAAAQVSPALYDYPRPGLDWYTLTTPHFNVVFHADSSGEGSSRTAQVVARIAEEIYGPITALYDHEPDGRVSFVLKDYEDYSNGAAYFFDNKIEIWAPALDSPLRGDHNWLRNVITHEFTHIVQVQKTMRTNRRLPFVYLQWLHYEDVKRPDVLYGYPNGIMTYPIPMLNNPAWLAEGTAQYQRAGLHYDAWDAHRDMFLRMRVLAGQEMSLDEMGGFYSHTSLLREGVYNHGYAFTRYLAQTYGEDVLRRISEALSRPGAWNVQAAIKAATGRSGGAVYDDWMGRLREGYAAGARAIRAAEVGGELVEAEGFQNFYPRLSPDGARLAYVSNRGEDYSRVALYVRDLATGETARLDEGDDAAPAAAYTCSMGHRLQRSVSGGIAWRPDGAALAYALTKDTKYGYYYDDLYEIDLATRRKTRLTTHLRASSPAYAPDGERIAFVRQHDGTTNLYVLHRADGRYEAVTRFQDGGQVSDPAWRPDGAYIYFARSARRGRDLYRVRPDGSGLEAVRATESDERSPAFSPDGAALYYASDQSGIFNLYRLPTDRPEAAPEQLTNVVGGAFMPDAGPGGRLAFARFESEGYKIALLARPAPLAADTSWTYHPPAVLQKAELDPAQGEPWATLAAFDDTDVQPLTGEGLAPTTHRETLPDGPPSAPVAPVGAAPIRRYRSLFTAFSFYPVVRLDQYVSRARSRLDASLGRRGAAETLLRNTKAGVYVSSREILEGLTFFGGIMAAPASREAGSLGGYFAPSHLLGLERDLFVNFEYRKGFGIFPQRWSPQVSLELFNIRRNVAQGLAIEEFPCTACYPETTHADLSYSLWQVDLALRSKLTRALLLEAGWRYSPYRVTTERFFSRESNQSIPESSSRYFVGRAVHATAYFEGARPYRNADVAPRGLRVEASWEYEPGRLLDRFDVENGILQPVYEEARNHRVSLDARIGWKLPGAPLGGSHGLTLRGRATTILGGAVDDFYNDYVGGLVGARGYPFYALGGNEAAWAQVGYGFPILPNVGRQVLFTYIDKLYGRLYADAAAAGSGSLADLGPVRKDVGAELRLGLGSYYLLPTAVFVSGTYGLDRFRVAFDDGLVGPDGAASAPYGREMQWHFGVLFSFDP